MMLNERFVGVLLLLVLHAFVDTSAVSSTAPTAKEGSHIGPCLLSDAEQKFVRQAGRLYGLMSEKRITCSQFRSIIEAHNEWDSERKRHSTHPAFVRSIGLDSERIRSRLKEQGHLNGAELRGFDMAWADLTGGRLNRADITGSGLRTRLVPGSVKGYSLGINLTRARLTGAEIRMGKAKQTLLRWALLIGVDFTGTDFSEAVLYGADMRWSNLTDTTLTGADFSDTDLQGVVFEPKPGKLPKIAEIASARNLEKMTYRKSPHQLSQLRGAFSAAGLKDQARRVTYAIEHTRRVMDGKRNFIGRVSSPARLVAFEWTANYGMNPFRPILILLALIPAFALVYFVALVKPGANRIWINRPKNAINRDELNHWLPVNRIIRGNLLRRFWRHLRAACWFSLMCAFRVGFREVNIGEWVTRLQPREYILGASGWCRTVTGVQSLISAYLLALSILCIVGRPFG